MVPLCLLLSLFAAFVDAQNSENLPSVIRAENNLDDSITEIFNLCKCVIFYQCDEGNFIIPQNELPHTQVTVNKSLRTIDRIRCSNEFYYCCKNRTETPIASSPMVVPQDIPPAQGTPSKVCGIHNSLSRGIIDKFPWTVAVYVRKKPNNNYAFKCGGSLIHPRVVMTERKCVHSLTSDQLAVVTGQEFLFQDSKMSVSKTIEHELYWSGGMHNDISLIILQSPVTTVNPVCLPTYNQNFNAKRCTAVGWSGRSVPFGAKLRKVDLPIIESQACQNLLRNESSLNPEFQVHSSQICAGGEEGRETCKGDAGGPLMCQENGRYVQVGISSWGVKCNKKGVPSVFTNVANLVPWIQQKLAAENLHV